MKLLLITSNDKTKEKVKSHFKLLGYDIIVYDNPLKALDNLYEISPQAVLFNAEDFPRHWKPFLQVLRQLFKREESVFIILKGELFDDDEALKAGSLSVSGVISENFENSEDINQLENILSRYLVHKELRGAPRISSGMPRDTEFIFNHPLNFKLITGKIVDVSFDGFRFEPDLPQFTADIKEGVNIPFCSLRFGDFTCSIGVRLVRNNKSLSFRFTDFDEADRDSFIDFLDGISKYSYTEEKA